VSFKQDNNGEGGMHRLVQKLLVFALLIPVGGSWGGSDDRSRELAMNNPILWKYFSRLAAGVRSAFDLGRHRREPWDFFGLEHRTGNLIRSFLQRIEVQTELLRLNTKRLVLFTGEESSPPLEEFRESLVGLEKASDKLRKLLNPVFMSINRNIKVRRPKAPILKSPADFYRAVETLGREASSAERKVRGYVFARDNVVSIEQLKGANMLVSLERVRNMARHLQKEF
jgi:uncharacterized protein with von Willebrand factor type A (vWA) domain